MFNKFQKIKTIKAHAWWAYLSRCDFGYPLISKEDVEGVSLFLQTTK
jgi:hypothetical protein